MKQSFAPTEWAIVFKHIPQLHATRHCGPMVVEPLLVIERPVLHSHYCNQCYCIETTHSDASCWKNRLCVTTCWAFFFTLTYSCLKSCCSSSRCHWTCLAECDVIAAHLSSATCSVHIMIMHVDRCRSDSSSGLRQRFRWKDPGSRSHGASRQRSGLHRLVRQDERSWQSSSPRGNGAADSHYRQSRNALLPQCQVFGYRSRQSYLRLVPTPDPSHQKYRYAWLPPLKIRSGLHHFGLEKCRKGQKNSR